MGVPKMERREFDLNMERVLEHWTLAHAVREVIANALDEQALTNTRMPEIERVGHNRWRVRDFGRGLRYDHLTQKENAEKLSHPDRVIGKFGGGLKDALATFHRRAVVVTVRSRHSDISIATAQKHGFSDIKTLHAVIKQPRDPLFVGTEFVLDGISDKDIDEAKSFFMLYSDEHVLEKTRYGDILKRKKGSARVYANGLCVATEDNFLFSYNITSTTAPLRRALNRERTNVGRAAYSDRVKALLLETTQDEVAHALVSDLTRLQTGNGHDELAWSDVAVHACRIMNASRRVVFVTASELQFNHSMTDRARKDNYLIVVVPGSIATKLSTVPDVAGNPIMNLSEYGRQYNESFKYRFVDPKALSQREQAVFAYTRRIISLVSSVPDQAPKVLISETMRVDGVGQEVVGRCEEGRIVIKRNQLQDLATYAGALLHELTHAISGEGDISLGFEQALTLNLGRTGTVAVGARP